MMLTFRILSSWSGKSCTQHRRSRSCKRSLALNWASQGILERGIQLNCMSRTLWSIGSRAFSGVRMKSRKLLKIMRCLTLRNSRQFSNQSSRKQVLSHRSLDVTESASRISSWWSWSRMIYRTGARVICNILSNATGNSCIDMRMPTIWLTWPGKYSASSTYSSFKAVDRMRSQSNLLNTISLSTLWRTWCVVS